MAVITPTITEIKTRGDRGHLITWGTLGAGDEGSPISMIGSTIRTAQIIGTFGAGSRVAIEGSNDGVTYATLTDSHGNALSFAGSGISTVSELTLYIRPRVTAGSPSASVKLLMRKTEER